jgi:hypothetical protein
MRLIPLLIPICICGRILQMVNFSNIYGLNLRESRLNRSASNVEPGRTQTRLHIYSLPNTTSPSGSEIRPEHSLCIGLFFGFFLLTKEYYLIYELY